MDERVVDPGLEDFLNKDLPQEKRDVFENDDEDDDPTKAKLLNEPISDSTRNAIIQAFLSALQTSPEGASKILHLFKSLTSFTEGEGQEYLEAITQADLATVSFHIVSIILRTLSQFFVNPSRPENIKLIIKDPYIRASVNATLRRVFNYLGNMSGIILFIAYAIDSYSPILLLDEDETEDRPIDEPPAKRARKEQTKPQ